MELFEAKPWSLLNAPTGPLACHLDAFAKDLSEQGFQRPSRAPQIRLVANFSRWLKANAVGLNAWSDEHVERFLRQTKRRRSIRAGHRAWLLRLMAFLRRTGVVDPQPAAPRGEASQIQRVVVTFGEPLLEAQALSRATCRQYLPFAEQFLTERFASGTVELGELSAADVVGFIRRQSSRLSPARAKSATIAMRSFLRYLRLRGDVAIDLAAAVPTVPNWSMTAIPRAIAPDHLRAVLDSCRRDTAVECRDYAILLLLARLGLRAGKIVALTLDSIDWNRGCLAVVGSKVGQNSELAMPTSQRLPPPVSARERTDRRPGVANQRWHHRGRRHCAGRSEPPSAWSPSVSPCVGLRDVAPGCQHQKTTSIYAKVDFAALRPLSLAWPGVAR